MVVVVQVVMEYNPWMSMLLVLCLGKAKGRIKERAKESTTTKARPRKARASSKTKAKIKEKEDGPTSMQTKARTKAKARARIRVKSVFIAGRRAIGRETVSSSRETLRTLSNRLLPQVMINLLQSMMRHPWLHRR